jgi:hypothetical protein
VRRASVSLAIRQCVALGFIEITRRGGRSISDVRRPSLYRLTYVFGRRDQSGPTDEWKRITKQEQAEAALERAATERNTESQLPRRSKKLDAKTELRGGAKAELQETDHPDAKAELLA